MSCKAPVITSNITSIPEVTGDASILINPYAEIQLENALVKLLNDKTLREELSQRGYENSLNFTWEKTAQKTLNAYESIVNSL